MSYEFYKIMHLIGLLIVSYGLWSLVSVHWNKNTPSPQLRKLWIIAHGVGLVLLLVGGFGLAARLGYISKLPVWVYCKLFIWFVIGGLATPVKRRPEKSAVLTGVIFVLLIAAVIVAVTKPFA